MNAEECRIVGWMVTTAGMVLGTLGLFDLECLPATIATEIGAAALLIVGSNFVGVGVILVAIARTLDPRP